MIRSVVVNGELHRSIAAAAKAHAIRYDLVSSRINEGWSIEEAFGFKQRNRKAQVISLEGREYLSISAAVAAYKISYKNVMNRIHNLGWSLEQAFELVPHPIKSKPITVSGKKYPSVAEAAKAYGLDSETVGKRLRSGWPTKEAFGIIKRRKTIADTGGIVYCITNIFTDKRYIGLTRRSLERRFREHACSRKSTALTQDLKALGTAVFRIETLVTCDTNKDLIEQESYFIDKFNTIRDGYNTHKGGGLGNTPGKVVRYRNKRYPSIADFSSKTGIPLKRAYKMIANGQIMVVVQHASS